MARPKTRGTRKIRGRKQKRRTRRKFHKGKKRTTRRKKGGMFKKNDKVKYKGKCTWEVVSYDGATGSYQLKHLTDEDREVNTPAEKVSHCDQETNIPPAPQLKRQDTMPFPESKSTSPPTLPQEPERQFRPIFTRSSPSPYEEAEEWVKKQTNVAQSMREKLHKKIAAKRAASAPPKIGGTRKRRRRKHKKRRKTKRL